MIFNSVLGLCLGFFVPLIASRFGKIIPADPGFLLLHLPHKVRKPKVYDPARLYQWKKKWRQLYRRCFYCAILTATLFGITPLLLPTSILWYAYAFFYMVILMIVIDAEYCLLPDFFTIPLLLAGLLFTTFGACIPIYDATIGACIGYLMSIVSVLLLAKSKNNQLGGGDVKLITASGVWFGPMGLSVCLILSFFLFIICSVLFPQKKGAYGPAFGLAAIITFFILYIK